MSEKKRFASRLALWSAALAVALGCGEKAPEPQEPVDVQPKGPDYQVFAPLPGAVRDAVLPMIIGEGVEEGPCFVPIDDAVPEEADLVFKELIEQHDAEVSDVIGSWLVDDVEVMGLTKSLTGGWTVTIAAPVVLSAGIDRVRFAQDPVCLDKSGWLPDGSHLATTLIGAREIHFETTLPLTDDLKDSMLQSLGMENIIVESPALFAYDAAIDENGEPLLSPEDKPLYNSPTGEFITEDQIPPPEQRLMKEWTIKAEAPIYFAFREFPADGVRRESDKDACNVILIPDVLKPQPPDCAEFRESAFSVTVLEGEEEPVALTITTGGENTGVTLGWKEATKVQVNDRIFLWLMPEKVEVGVNLWVNSLTLDPEPLAEVEGGGFEPAAEPEVEPEPDDEPEPAAEPAKKKKSGGSDVDAIDSFLRD